MEWIDVNERLPEEDRPYFCAYSYRKPGEDDGLIFYGCLHYFLNDQYPHFQHEGYFGLRVTHWMPIPELPK